MAVAHDAYAALRLRDYRRLLTAGVLASLGAEMQAVAVGWEITYPREGEPWQLGMVGLVQFLPVLLLALPAGQAADRWNRRFILGGALVVMVAAALGLATLAWCRGPLWLMYLCLGLAGMARAFSIPARWALLPQVVPADALRNAVAWNSTGWQLATISGPALGGFVIDAVGATGAYALTAGCQVVSMALILSLRVAAPPGRAAADADGSATARLRAWSAGATFIWRTKPILATITLDLFAVLLGGATALLPLFARDILATEAFGLGWLRAAPAAGALVMALTLAHRPPLARPGIALIAAVAGFGLATILFGVSTNYYLSWIALALTGAFDNVSVVVRGTLIQTLTPDALRGRVAGVNALFISSSNELGSLESGLAAQWLGPTWAVVTGGVGTLAVVAVAVRVWPELWRLTATREVRG